MADWLATSLERWVDAGLLERTAAEKIRAFETDREATGGLRWQVVLALGFGALLVGAGVLLFVSAHWDEISPASRFALVLGLVAVFHVAGALTERAFPALATALHALGTIVLGAGIFLTGQIFNLAEHWPGALMVWAAGAWLGFWLRRDWVQGTLAALLTPAWLAGEWDVAAERFTGAESVVARGVLLLALVYLSARASGLDSPLRRALVWCGGIALLPAATLLWDGAGSQWRQALPERLQLWGWVVGLGLPLVVAWLLRRRDAWVSLLWAVWIVALEFMIRETKGGAVLQYVWLALGAVGLVAWGLEDRRKERVNLGVVGFALSILAFYFSQVLDKLGRAAGMIGLGLLFLGGGWLLERTRRRLMARLEDRP
jgi:uncharacterized membrane protein